MADRVHPSYGGDNDNDSPLNSSEHPLKPSPPSPEKPVPPAGTYVIQVPKEQVYRVPPPENARRFELYSRRKQPRGSCLRWCVWSSIAVFTLISGLFGASAAALYLVFRPESPRYAVESVAIRGFNASSSSPEISPEVDVTVRAHNPNDNLGIFYGERSSVKMLYSDLELCHGVMPAFFHPTNNVTVIVTALKGPGIQLTEAVRRELKEGEKKGLVPLKLRMKMPVKIKVGSVKTWTLAVRVHCGLTVNKLTADAKIVFTDCDRTWKLWW